MAQGEQVHMSSYPPIWPTRPASEAGGYNLRRAIEIRAGSHAFEAKVFNVVASGCLDLSIRDELARLDKAALDTLENSPPAVSMILDPTGEVISEVLSDREGIVYAEIDVARCIEPKQFHDVVGYYNRFDIFHLEVDRTPRDPAAFLEAEAIGTLAQTTMPGAAERTTAPQANGGRHSARSKIAGD
jgi:nitrilase